MKILKRIKEWFLNRFLPMWAKETVLEDNRRLRQEVAQLRNELEQKTAYINGMMAGTKSLRRIVINTKPQEDKK